MLKYTFIEPEGMVHHIDNYFDNWYEDEWMKDSDVCSIIKDIDNIFFNSSNKSFS